MGATYIWRITAKVYGPMIWTGDTVIKVENDDGYEAAHDAWRKHVEAMEWRSVKVSKVELIGQIANEGD